MSEKDNIYEDRAQKLDEILDEIGLGQPKKKPEKSDKSNMPKRSALEYDPIEEEIEERDDDSYFNYEDYDYDDEDDYLGDDGILGFLISRSEKKKKAKKKKLSKRETVDSTDDYIETQDMTGMSQTEKLDVDQIRELSDLDIVEAELDAGEYDNIDENDPNAGIYEYMGGLKAEDDYDGSYEEDEDEISDSERFFQEKILEDEPLPKEPKPKKQSKLSSNTKWLIAFGVLLVTLVILVACYFSSLAKLKYSEMNINKISEDEIVANKGVAEKVKGYKTIVLYGVDSREANIDSATNSDSIIIVSINEKTNKVKLVSVYRDTLLNIESTSNVGTQKVNYAYQLGGAKTSINTLNKNLDLYITDYVAVDFGGLSDIIDAIGGVEIDIKEDEINNLNKNLAEQIRISGAFSDGVYNAGKQTLNGQQAVAYSRIRSTAKGDITRSSRQRQVLLKIVEKAKALGTDNISSLVDVSFECISTSIEKDDALDLAKSLVSCEVESSIGFPFTYEGVNLNKKGAVLVPADLSANVTALHKYLYDDASYTPSDNVSKQSASILSETGVEAQAVSIPADDNASGNKESDGSKINTIVEPPSDMIINE